LNSLDRHDNQSTYRKLRIGFMGRLALTVWLVVSAVFVSSDAAHAYIDPGAGSVLLQALIGGIAAGFGVIALYYARLKAVVAKLLARKNKSHGGDSVSK
jgi:hypothetical protein